MRDKSVLFRGAPDGSHPSRLRDPAELGWHTRYGKVGLLIFGGFPTTWHGVPRVRNEYTSLG